MRCIIQDLVLAEKRGGSDEEMPKICVSLYLKLASIIASGREWDMEWGDIKVI